MRLFEQSTLFLYYFVIARLINDHCITYVFEKIVRICWKLTTRKSNVYARSNLYKYIVYFMVPVSRNRVVILKLLSCCSQTCGECNVGTYLRTFLYSYSYFAVT